MLRILSLLILSGFAFSSIEYSSVALGRSAHAGCCCKSDLCRCSHDKHVTCPIAKKHSSHRTDNAPIPAAPGPARKINYFTPGGCGIGVSPAHSTGLLRDIFVMPDFPKLPFQNNVLRLKTASPNFSFLTDGRLDRPPRALLFSHI